MQCFPVPANEKERLTEVRRLRRHEWGASVALQDLCAMAARLLDTPMAHLSLVDRNEQLFAGRFGLDAERVAREISFCAHAIMSSKPFIVENAANDPRFRQNPFVTEAPNIRAYLGIPLELTPGLPVGALCAIDQKPRAFTESEVQTLTGLAGIAASLLRSCRATQDLDDQLEKAIALQQEMLPSKGRIQRIETACPLEVASYYRALDGIGGDIWGIESTSPHRVLMYVADFTGHGLSAALNTARFHSFLHLASRCTDEPAMLLHWLNELLQEVLPVGQFATMFCATLDFSAQTMSYASAGAPPQLYRRSLGRPSNFW